jgi:hypothetical protein
MQVLDDGWIANLKKQEPDLAFVLLKWRPRILGLAHRLNRNTGDDIEDVLQDFIAKVWTDVQYFKQPQVRYQKGIWEVVSVLANDTLHLKRTANKKTQEIFLKRSETEEIKQTSLATFVYSGLQQYYLDRNASHFTQQNGYALNENDPTTLRTTVDKGQKVVKEFPNYHKVAGVVQSPVLPSENGVEVEIVDLAPGDLESPEDHVILDQLIGYVSSKLSTDAKKLLHFLLGCDEDFLVMMDLDLLRLQGEGKAVLTSSGPKIDEAAAANFFSKSKTEIRNLRMEIIEALPQDFLTYTTGTKRQPLVRNALAMR